PIRWPRNRETRQSTNVNGLYPCGEGAGYAGGIISAALDGIHTAMTLIAPPDIAKATSGGTTLINGRQIQ
ncbi:MAG: hypothetical protein L3J82_01625, partial [Planctomycetes bacterium]|nr:hypothetical protein [Planctomycetota bacterium]